MFLDRQSKLRYDGYKTGKYCALLLNHRVKWQCFKRPSLGFLKALSLLPAAINSVMLFQGHWHNSWLACPFSSLCINLPGSRTPVLEHWKGSVPLIKPCLSILAHFLGNTFVCLPSIPPLLLLISQSPVSACCPHRCLFFPPPLLVNCFLHQEHALFNKAQPTTTFFI